MRKAPGTGLGQRLGQHLGGSRAVGSHADAGPRIGQVVCGGAAGLEADHWPPQVSSLDEQHGGHANNDVRRGHGDQPIPLDDRGTQTPRCGGFEPARWNACLARVEPDQQVHAPWEGRQEEVECLALRVAQPRGQRDAIRTLDRGDGLRGEEHDRVGPALE